MHALIMRAHAHVDGAHRGWWTRAGGGPFYLAAPLDAPCRLLPGAAASATPRDVLEVEPTELLPLALVTFTACKIQAVRTFTNLTVASIFASACPCARVSMCTRCRRRVSNTHGGDSTRAVNSSLNCDVCERSSYTQVPKADRRHPEPLKVQSDTFTILRKLCSGCTFTVLRPNQLTFTDPPPYASGRGSLSHCVKTNNKVQL